jgi:integrase
MIYKRGNTYHYAFVFKGRRYRASTRQGNSNVARQIESARRTQLAKGEVGIADKPRVPTLKEFIPRFEQHIETECADKPKTVEFYKGRLPALLGFAPLAGRPLDAINEEVIEAYKRERTSAASRRGTPFAVSTINRELATLRRLLRLARRWKIVTDTPGIALLGGERNREFVLAYAQEESYLHMAPDPLRDAATLILDTGMRAGEALALRWEQVRLEPARASRFGFLTVKSGKSEKAKRNLSLTARVAEMLARRVSTVHGAFVFPGDRKGTAFQVASLDHQHSEHRELLGLPSEFVIHSLRHTMLTRLGEAGADAFTIMRIAGHSSITVSQRYVHPSPEHLELAFERLDTRNTSRRGVDTKSATAPKRASAEKSDKPFLINTMGA